MVSGEIMVKIVNISVMSVDMIDNVIFKINSLDLGVLVFKDKIWNGIEYVEMIVFFFKVIGVGGSI